jgi:Protein of unknown function (DUF2911)
MTIKRQAIIFSISALIFAGCNGKDENKPEPILETNDTTTLVPSDVIVNPYAPPDISPMDMSYFPAEYPQLKMTHSVKTLPVARVIYSRPHREGRVIFGQLVKYGEPWRLGANEATEIDFFQNVSIENKKVRAGRYILYAIPQENEWTIVLNSNIDTWGLQIDSTKDLMRFTATVSKSETPIEFFTMVFRKSDTGANLIMTWDYVKATLPINF